MAAVAQVTGLLVAPTPVLVVVLLLDRRSLVILGSGEVMVDGRSGGYLVSRLDTTATVWTDITPYWQPPWPTTTAARGTTIEIRLTSARGPDDDGLAGVLARV